MDLDLKYRSDGRLTLISARELFVTIRKKPESVIVRRHAYKDHPERHFTREEWITLVMTGAGQLHENHEAPTAQYGSFLFRVNDSEKRECHLVLCLDEDASWKVLVISAFRRI